MDTLQTQNSGYSGERQRKNKETDGGKQGILGLPAMVNLKRERATEVFKCNIHNRNYFSVGLYYSHHYTV